MNESLLIGKAEKFLDIIRRSRVKADDINDIEDFIDIYGYLKGNLDELQELRDLMEIKGYKAPYRSVIKYGRAPYSEMKVEDIHDITRHTQYFRMKAAAKKNILDRVKSSIASHKIAIGHLEEFATVNCNACSRRFQGHELAVIASDRCSCGSELFQLEINQDGVYRLPLIKYLPLSGEYMVKMSELSPLGRDAFRKIVRILKQEKRGIVKTLSLVVKIFEDGHWVRKRVNLDARDQLNYEREIRKKYGSNARIEFLQFHRKKPAIINDKHVQTALSIAYVKFAENHARRIFEDILVKLIKNQKKLEIYQEEVQAGESFFNNIKEDLDDGKELKNEIISEKLVKKNLMDPDGVLDRELQHDLQVKEKLEEDLFVDLPRTLILWDILKYYLSTSYDRRSKHSGPFPNLRPNLDKNQIKAFEDFKPSVVGILKEYLPENIEYVPQIKKVLSKKFEMENKMRGLHVKMNPPAVGAAILNTVGGISLEESSRIFSVSPREAQAEKKKFTTFEKATSEKAQQFMAMIRK